MIIEWIGRVFGMGGTGDSTTSMSAGAGLSDLAASTASVVDTDELAAELARARRYEHPLSTVVLSAHPLRGGGLLSGNGRAPSVETETKLPQMVALITAVALKEVVRCSDVVCYHAAENRFVLALPESDAEGARSAVDRIREHFRSRFQLGVQAGLAGFPADAYTLDELIATAAARISFPTFPGYRAAGQLGTLPRAMRRNGSFGRLSRGEGA